MWTNFVCGRILLLRLWLVGLLQMMNTVVPGVDVRRGAGPGAPVPEGSAVLWFSPEPARLARASNSCGPGAEVQHRPAAAGAELHYCPHPRRWRRAPSVYGTARAWVFDLRNRKHAGNVALKLSSGGGAGYEEPAATGPPAAASRKRTRAADSLLVRACVARARTHTSKSSMHVRARSRTGATEVVQGGLAAADRGLAARRRRRADGIMGCAYVPLAEGRVSVNRSLTRAKAGRSQAAAPVISLRTTTRPRRAVTCQARKLTRLKMKLLAQRGGPEGARRRQQGRAGGGGGGGPPPPTPRARAGACT
jgi:hypothetical protein